MLLGERDYQRAFFKLVINKSERSIDDISTDLFIHKNTLRKWVSGEQAAPAIAYSALGMYMKLLSLGEIFSINNDALRYEKIFSENAHEEMKRDSFRNFEKKAKLILESASDDDVADLALYFLYSCIHDKNKVEEVCFFVKNHIVALKEKSTKGIFSTSITGTLLISCYMSLYPDESIQSIRSAYTVGLIDKNVMSFAVDKRLKLIDYKYDLFIADLKWSVVHSKDENLKNLLSKFDYDSDNFSPDEFISLFDQIKNLYINKNGTDTIDSRRAFNLSLHAIRNFDFL